MAGCSYNETRSRTIIRGKLPGVAGSSITLSEIDIKKLIPLLETKINNDGSFKFSFNRPGPGFYLVEINNNYNLTLILDKEKHIYISANSPEGYKNIKIEGSTDSELYLEFEKLHDHNRQIIDSLRRIFHDYQRLPSFEILKRELDENYERIFMEQRALAIKFIENNCQSLASLLVINRRFGQRVVFDENDDFHYYTLLDSCLSIRYPGNKHLTEHQRKIAEIQNKVNDLNELPDNFIQQSN